MRKVPMQQTPMPRQPGRTRRRVSMADVAKLAGVSGQTVSRVANGRENVDQATRARVLDAMRQLGYRPNSAARALRNGRFRTLGVIMFELTSLGNTRTLDAVASAAAAAGFAITLMPVSHPTQREVTGAFSRLGEQAVDGIVILIEATQLDHSDIELPDGLPVVVVNSSARYRHPVVDTDQAQGARLATEHLLDLGHRTVWHIAGPGSSYSAERRERSWRDTLRRHGRTPPGVLIGDWSADSGYRLGADLVARDPQVTAVFAANDQMALGLLQALHEAGRRIPGDVSVVGFDDMPESAHFWPPLTTVRQSFADVGRRAVTALLEEIRVGEERREPIYVGTELVVRASTGHSPAPRR
jgi:DNA-binding LacI/PurR family transcriptional regulator